MHPVEAGLMREEGEGIPRMFEEMEASFLRVPEFRVEAGEVYLKKTAEGFLVIPRAACGNAGFLDKTVACE